MDSNRKRGPLDAMPEPELPEQPYGPAAICDTCGHFAGRHDEKGCRGMNDDYDCHCAPRRGHCQGFLWKGVIWPRPWLPAPEGLKAE